MKVILLDNIKGVGKKDEVINASDGYARNFLLPRKLAVEANSENMSKLNNKKDEAANNIKEAKEPIKNLGSTQVNVKLYEGIVGVLKVEVISG